MTKVPHTIGSILKISEDWLAVRGVDQPKVDAGTLLAHALQMKRLDLYLQTDRPLLEPELAAFRPLLQRRGKREPVSRILGRKGFWNHDFMVTPEVLSPRADSELLVELSLSLDLDDQALVLDLCTGSGCLAISIAAERANWTLTGSDLSKEALDVAQHNAQQCIPERSIEWIQSDGFNDLNGQFDLIVTNPPYIGTTERDQLDPEVAQHDPHLALFSGDDGLDLVRRIVAQSSQHLRSKGWLLVEHGHTQGEALRDLLTDHGFESIKTHRDLGQRERVSLGRWPGVD